MKFECIKDKMLDAVQKVDRVAGKHLTLPILRCALFEAHGSLVRISATDLSIGVEISLPAKVSSSGKIAVPAALLNSYLSNLTGVKNIKIESQNDNMLIQSDKSTTLIKSFPVDDFPSIPKSTDVVNVTLSGTEFAKGLRSTHYSGSLSSMKPELSSVFVYPDEHGILCVATDSFRLAEKRVKSKKTKEWGPILIPQKSVVEIVRMAEVVGELMVAIGSHQVSFEREGVYLTSRLVEGAFPDYKQILPKEHTTKVVVLKDDLLSALRAANTFSDKFNQIRFKVRPKEKLFELSTKNADVGENANRVEAVLEGDDVEITFNYKYLTDCFQSIESDSISLAFNGGSKPLLLSGVGDQTFKYLVMPNR